MKRDFTPRVDMGELIYKIGMDFCERGEAAGKSGKVAIIGFQSLRDGDRHIIVCDTEQESISSLLMATENYVASGHAATDLVYHSIAAWLKVRTSPPEFGDTAPV
jgi:hypothetical protein